ncbi:hypothetical protein SETIT_6G051000v2 [Setaria italica]|uniref:DUF4220 domain-containing protein n=2 Tax=Setaria italica TaxID=4555 RepID=A0A368RI67_SETIT|nr:hypothetical protein SETIT_6G051000v2 [Setaria italica]
MAQGLARQWNDWGIQILVLMSFTLQVLLLVFAETRRRKSPAPVRLLLWLMYQLADSTAIYTLGHLSVASSKARDPHLLAFWAPFLLVHLGGPGTITAYALEDNRLWLRHLLTLLVQVLAAAFVIYKYIKDGSTLLLLAAMLVFVVGILKYGERTLALWRANISSIRSALKYPDGEKEFNLSHWRKLRWPYPRKDQDNGDEEPPRKDQDDSSTIGDEELPRKDQDNSTIGDEEPPRKDQDNKSIGDEELLLGAHSLFHICKSMFADATLYLSKFNGDCSTRYASKDLFGLVEMDMSLMYDILYTKAAVDHTWYGYTILVFSPLATAAALMLFHYSSDKRGGGKANVGITYALLSGTLALETISLARAIGSTWACALMYCCGWERLLGAVTFLRRRTKAASKRRWSGSMGQYNLLHVCTRDKTELGNRLAAMLGLQNLWNKVHYSGTIPASAATDIKDRLLKATGLNAGHTRGVGTLETMKIDRNSAYLTYSSVTNDSFDDSILSWHIATDVYLSQSKMIGHQEKLVAAVRVLSNYMMFLLMAQPEMLPGPIRQGQYADTCNELDKVWDKCLADRKQGADPDRGSPQKWWSMLKKLFQRDKPNASRMPQIKELATKLLSTIHNDADNDEEDPGFAPVFFLIARPAIEGPRLAEEFLAMDSDSFLEVIFYVWLEMLCYAAHHCDRDSHARRLNNGGEFITVVWLAIHQQQHIGTVG